MIEKKDYTAVEDIVADWLKEFRGSEYADTLATRLRDDPYQWDSCVRECREGIREWIGELRDPDERERALEIFERSREIADRIEEGVREAINEAEEEG